MSSDAERYAAALLLFEVEQRGVRIELGDGALTLRGAARALPPETTAALAAHKPALLELLQRRTSGDRREQPISAPAAPSQQRLWVLGQTLEGSIAYNMPGALLLTGALDPQRFEAALRQVGRRHEALRTTFAAEAGELRQVIHADARLDFAAPELPAGSDRLEQAQAAAFAAAIAPFDFVRGPLVRVRLYRLAEEKWFCAFTMHHLVSDGWSMQVLLREAFSAYAAEADYARRAPPTVQYREYAGWLLAQRDSEKTRDALRYWQLKLGGERPPLNLPADRPRPGRRSYQGASHRFAIERGPARALDDYARRHRTTLFVVLTALVKVVLHRYTGQTDLIVGTPVANRDHPVVAEIIGLCADTLALRDTVPPEITFGELVQQVNATVREAYAHADCPFDAVIEAIGAATDRSHNPVFDVMVVMNPARGAIDLPGLAIEAHALPSRTAKFDLTVYFEPDDAELGLTIEYDTQLFDAGRIARLGTHLQTLARELMAAPDRPIAQIDCLPAAERTQLLRTFNATARAIDHETPVHRWFEQQAERSPDAYALSRGAVRLRYGELNAAANRLARTLRASGVEPGLLVAVMAERTIEVVVALLAVLKAGAAYVPIDPAYPPERIRYMVEDCGARVVLGSRADLAALPAGPTAIPLDDALAGGGDGSNLDPSAGPDALVYVIYTSGSTGRPKGSGVRHRGFANLLRWYAAEIEAQPQARTTLLTSLSFDLTQKNIYAPLVSGGELCLAERAEFDPVPVRELIARRELTWINCTPSMFTALLDVCRANAFEDLRSLRHVVLGGEPINHRELQAWQASPHCRGAVINSYGPTECADVAVSHRIDPAELERRATALTGRPIWNVRTYVVGPQRQLQPIGIPGELCITGVGVGSGYHRQPELTAEKFVSCPFEPGQRMYRTGDVAVVQEDGAIDYLGRADHQVKVRGYRVELEEVAAAVREASGLREVVVTAHSGADVPSAAAVICAYLVTDRPIDVPELEARLRTRLPRYMIPTHFVPLPALPLSPNGKVDRQALPRPGLVTKTPVAPRNEIETKLAAIWREVLGAPQFGVHDSFFELGGHSLLAMKVGARIRDVFGREVRLQELFTRTTIAELAECLAATPVGDAASAAMAPAEEGAI
jgi:amino acid adenylation domain-containing protein